MAQNLRIGHEGSRDHVLNRANCRQVRNEGNGIATLGSREKRSGGRCDEANGGTRKSFFVALALAAVAAAGLFAPCTSWGADGQETPGNDGNRSNVVLFLIDDLGYSDVGAYGSRYYETPHIDQLAREGMLFTDAYASGMVCSPTRAALLTGKTPGRVRITHAIPIFGHLRLENPMFLDADYVMNLPLEEVTLAEALQDSGYKTAHMGKWHLSWEEEYYPEHQGFGLNIGGNNMGNPGNYFSPYNGRWRMTRDHPFTEWNVLPDSEEGEYLTDRLTDEAIQFIEGATDEPFFLYLPHYAVHTPIQGRKDLVEKYKAKPVDEERGHTHAGYAAMVESVDESVGRILEALDRLDLTENTIVIFTSDNGGHGKFTSNWPFRGNKGNFYEGGIRVPLIVKWPGRIEPDATSDMPVITHDLYPTLLGLLGLPLKPEQHQDGIDFSPHLTDGTSVTRGDALYWHFPNYTASGHPDAATPQGAIRDGDWKLIERFEDGSVELFNLRDDLAEEQDVAEQYPERAAELRKKLNAWRDRSDVQMPRPNPDYRPTPPEKES